MLRAIEIPFYSFPNLVLLMTLTRVWRDLRIPDLILKCFSLATSQQYCTQPPDNLCRAQGPVSKVILINPSIGSYIVLIVICNMYV